MSDTAERGVIRVAYVIDHLALGGAQTQVRSLIAHLDSERFDVEVFALRGCADQSYRFRELGCKVRCYPRSLITLPFSFLDFCYRMRRMQFDIVHFHLAGACAFGWFGRHTIPGATKIVQHLQIDLSKATNYFGANAKLASIADAVIGCSQLVTEQAHSLYKVPKEKLHLLYNVVDLDRFDAARESAVPGLEGVNWEDTVVVWTGRLTRQKNVPMLLRAWPEVTEQVNAQLLLVGHGPLKDDLQRQVRDLGIEDSVIFAGYRDDVPAILWRCDLFVFPSFYEGFGISAAEAMAAHLAVIGTDIPGLREVVKNGQTGILVDVDSEAMLAEAIIKLIREAETREAMGACGRERVEEEFSAVGVSEQLPEIYENLVSTPAISDATEQTGDPR